MDPRKRSAHDPRNAEMGAHREGTGFCQTEPCGAPGSSTPLSHMQPCIPQYIPKKTAYTVVRMIVRIGEMYIHKTF